MFKTQSRIQVLYIIADLIFIAMVFFMPYLIKFNYEAVKNANFKYLCFPNFPKYLVIFTFWAVLTVASLMRRGLYSTNRSITIPKEISSVLIALTYTTILPITIIFLAQYRFFSRSVFVANFVLLCLFLTLWRVIKRQILRVLVKKGFNNFNVLIIGGGEIARMVLEEIKAHPFLGLRVLGVIDNSQKDNQTDSPFLGELRDFARVCNKYFIDEVFITKNLAEDMLSNIFETGRSMLSAIRIVPPDFHMAMANIYTSYLGYIPFLTYKERTVSVSLLMTKRIFDFVVSFFLLIVLLPFFIVVAIIIKLDSSGSIFYVQKRMGLKGKVFNFYKLRSMYSDADEIKSSLFEKNESKGNIIFKIRNDPRITPFGSFLRRYSLDEFPQLINVLKGDMGLIGPRPFPVEESQKFEHSHLPRLTVRPGITGLAQIKGRSDLSAYHWIKWDLWYVNNLSLALDFMILWKTIPVVLKGKGAY